MIRCCVGKLSSVIYILVFFLVSFSDQKSILAPERQKMYQDVVSGLGLYNNFKEITELTPINFKDLVYSKESPKLWIVEFYNSWCGHCHRFAPIYKSFAVETYDWREVVGIGAVDCANDKNNQLCRDYEIMAYPSLKIFPVHSPDTFLGDDWQKGHVDDMVTALVKELETEQYSGYSKKNLNLKPFNESDLNLLWFNVPPTVKYTFLVVQDETNVSYNLGSEVALDLLPVKESQTRTVYTSNKGLMLTLPTTITPNVYAVNRSNNHVENLQLEDATVKGIIDKVVAFLKANGINASLTEKKDVSDFEFDFYQAKRVMESLEEIRKKLDKKNLSDVIFQVDLESALQYSLYHEIGNKKDIVGEKMEALKNYLAVLEKYFPFGKEGKTFLSNLKNDMMGRDAIKGDNFTIISKQYENNSHAPFLTKQDWIGCKGSQAHFRGYPCGLWTMFHMLTVQANLRERDAPSSSDPQEVLKAMTGYITYFFGCTDCSEHFQTMSPTMPGNVSNHDDSVLWLWKAHNSVNQRLAGDVTEDPEHRKVQFPSAQTCAACRDDNGEWVSEEVLRFLRRMYSNISYIQWSDLLTTPQPSTTTERTPAESPYSKRLRHETVGHENGFLSHNGNSSNSRSTWDFNLFDISLCVVLYVSSVVILFMVCVKFVVRKGYRKKPYSFDAGHGKV
ncbi:sulfhydryl oxidase 1 [Nilaparvata lugens]|uniref:sulfhydryl oxidase 1 n=1 Tax=Nilaparvata lugens TaxID=108931 RepID=UPI00193E2F3C|nr:sulfhydryl oxidase 1 [Nilaparvata lugens]